MRHPIGPGRHRGREDPVVDRLQGAHARLAENRDVLLVRAGRVLTRLDVVPGKTTHRFGKTEPHRERALHRRREVGRHLNRQWGGGSPFARLRPVTGPLVVGGPHLHFMERARLKVRERQGEPRPLVVRIGRAAAAGFPVLHVVVGDGRPAVVRRAPIEGQTVGRLPREGRGFRDTRRFPPVGHPHRQRLLRLQLPGSGPAPHFQRHHVFVVPRSAHRIRAGCVYRGLVIRRCPEAQHSRIGSNRELPLIDPAHNRPARHLVPRVGVPGHQPPRRRLVLPDIERTRTRDRRGRVWRSRGVGHRPVAQRPSVVAHCIPDRVGPRCVAHLDPRLPVLHRRVEGHRHHAPAYRDSRNASPATPHLDREVPRRGSRRWIERLPVGQRQRGSLHRRAQKLRPDPVHLVAGLGRPRLMGQLRRIVRLIFDRPSVQSDAPRLHAHPVGVFVPIGHRVAEHQCCRVHAFQVAGHPVPAPYSQPQLRPPLHVHRLAEADRHLDRVPRRISLIRSRVRTDG